MFRRRELKIAGGELSPPRRRRVFWPVVISLLICSDVYFIADRFAPSAIPTVERLWRQHRLMGFGESSDRIVFAPGGYPGFDSAHGYVQDVADLNAGPQLSWNLHGAVAPGLHPPAAERPAAIVHSAAAGKREADFLAAEESWNSLHPWLLSSIIPGSFGVGADDAPAVPEFTIFAHGLRLPSGEPRLLFVRLGWHPHKGYLLQFNAEIFSPGTWSATSKGISSSLFCVRSPHQSAELRLYAPQPDSSDPSRFTIAYELPEGSGVIEGQLMDTDAVEWKIVSGPAVELWKP